MKTVFRPTYSLLDEMMASPTEPITKELQTNWMTLAWESLASIEKSPEPAVSDWRNLSDIINITESLKVMRVIDDSQNLLHDAVRSMAYAGQRKLKNQHIG